MPGPPFLEGEASDDGQCDIDEAWRKLRLRHARECIKFVRRHQIRCCDILEHEIHPDTQKQVIYDKLVLWFRSAGIEPQRKQQHVLGKASQ